MLRPPALLKEYRHLLVRAETIFLKRTFRSIHRNLGRLQDWLGGFQRGNAPFVSSRKRGSRGRNSIERVSPSAHVFGCFLHEQKATRGVGPKAPRPQGRSSRQQKSPPSHLQGRKAHLPRYHPYSRIYARSCPCNGGPPSRSHGPLPGEPRDTLQGGSQPVTASLWRWANSLFSRSSHVSNKYLYHRTHPLARGLRGKIFLLRKNSEKVYHGRFAGHKIAKIYKNFL